MPELSLERCIVSQAEKGETYIPGKGCLSKDRKARSSMVGTGDHKQLELLELKIVKGSSLAADAPESYVLMDPLYICYGTGTPCTEN